MRVFAVHFCSLVHLPLLIKHNNSRNVDRKKKPKWKLWWTNCSATEKGNNKWKQFHNCIRNAMYKCTLYTLCTWRTQCQSLFCLHLKCSHNIWFKTSKCTPNWTSLAKDNKKFVDFKWKEMKTRFYFLLTNENSQRSLFDVWMQNVKCFGRFVCTY